MALYSISREGHVAPVLQDGVLRVHVGVDLGADMPAVSIAEQTSNVLASPDRAADHQRARIGHIGEGPRTEHRRQHEAVVRVEVREQDEREVVHRCCGAADEGRHGCAAVDEDAAVNEIPRVATAVAERAPAAEDGQAHGTRLAAAGRWY